MKLLLSKLQVLRTKTKHSNRVSIKLRPKLWGRNEDNLGNRFLSSLQCKEGEQGKKWNEYLWISLYYVPNIHNKYIVSSLTSIL